MGMVKLSEKEIQVLEASLNHATYKEAAKSINMDYKVFSTYLSRIRRKVDQAKKFLNRMKKYGDVLYKHYGRGEEVV